MWDSGVRSCNRDVISAMERWHLKQRALNVSCRYDMIVLAMAMFNTSQSSGDGHRSDAEKLVFVDVSDIGNALDLDQDNDLVWNQTTG